MDNAIIPQMIKAMWPVISEYIQQKTIDDLEMLANKQLTRIPMFDNFTFKIQIWAQSLHDFRILS